MDSCTKCGSQLNENAKFCPECGATVSVNRPAYCKKCGNALSPQVKFCDQCGENISSNPAPTPPPPAYQPPPPTYQPPPAHQPPPQTYPAQHPTPKIGMFTALKGFAFFSGRSTRKEYWLFQLFLGISTFIAFILSIVLERVTYHIYISHFVYFTPLELPRYFYCVFLLPMLAVTVRRLHDTGKSGWFLLLGLIPVVGSLILFVFMLLPSAKQDNQYGPFPL